MTLKNQPSNTLNCYIAKYRLYLIHQLTKNQNNYDSGYYSHPRHPAGELAVV